MERLAKGLCDDYAAVQKSCKLPLVARPRYQLYRHEKVACFGRPFRFLSGSHVYAR